MCCDAPKWTYLSHFLCCVCAIGLSVRPLQVPKNRQWKSNLLKQMEFIGLQNLREFICPQGQLDKELRRNQKEQLWLSPFRRSASLATVFEGPGAARGLAALAGSCPTGNSASSQKSRFLLRNASLPAQSVCPEHSTLAWPAWLASPQDPRVGFRSPPLKSTEAVWWGDRCRFSTRKLGCSY